MEAPPPDPQSIRIAKSATARTPRVVANARDLTVGVIVDGAPVDLISMPELTLERGSRTAIVGENGAGKTTFLQTLLGERPPLRGSVKLGDRVRVGYHRQGSDDLPGCGTVLEAMQAIRNIPPEEEPVLSRPVPFPGATTSSRACRHSAAESARGWPSPG